MCSLATARLLSKVCREVGLPVDGMLLGRDVEAMSDPELQAAVDRCTVFARLNPLQKARIVGQLQARGHAVGFMGDGYQRRALAAGGRRGYSSGYGRRHR